MPDKEGSEDEKTTKGVVKKKQKQMMGEEGYDTYRDNILMRGGDHRSKETRERSYTPTGKQPKGDTPMQKEFKKKYGKKATALDAVKQKYKGQIMDVGKKSKKKANEELDLTKIAEAFGGYIVEANGDDEKKLKNTNSQRAREAKDPNPERSRDLMRGAVERRAGKRSEPRLPKPRPDSSAMPKEMAKKYMEVRGNKKDAEPELKGIEKIPVTTNEPVRVSDPNFQMFLDRLYGTKTSSQVDADIVKRRTPTFTAAKELAQRRETDLPVVTKVLQKTAKKAGVPDIFTNKPDTNVDTTKPIRDEKGNIIANPPEPTEKQTDRKRQQVKKDAYSKPETARKGERVVNQGEFSTRTGVVGRGGVEVTTGKGDGRRAGRTKQERKTGKVTYKTFVNKPEVTGGQDRATDTMSRVDFQQPPQPQPDKVTQSQTAFVEPPLQPEKKPRTIPFKEPKEYSPEIQRQINKIKRNIKKREKENPDRRTKKYKETQAQADGGGKVPPGRAKVTTSGGGESGGENSIVSLARKAAKNPAISFLTLDAIRKYLPSRSPFGVVGGRAGTRSAAR